MYVEHPVSPIHHGRRYWLRMAIGTPILIGAFLILALVGWGTFGFRADMAPRFWTHEILGLLALVFYGGVASVMGGIGLWVLGRIIFVLGDGIINQWRQVWRRPA